MGRYFGTDGVRGEANKTLLPETAFKIGRFLGYHFSKDKKAKVVIGKDTRLSSSMFEYALASGVVASGADAYLIGYCSTPCLAFEACKDEFSCGVMISASHNPYKDNGIKVFGNNGLKADSKLEEPMEDYIDGLIDIDYATSENVGRIIDYSEAIKEYQMWLLKLYPSDLSNYNIAIDLCNGSNCYTAKDILNKTNIKATYINDEPNGTNINNNCGSTHIDALSSLVKNGHYDLGFAFDGDADRVLFVDEDGDLFDGDKVMYLLSKYLKDNGLLKDNTLVTTVMSNIGLFKSLEKIGVRSEITAVGDKNVVDMMAKNDYSVGGEQSGHIIIKKDALIGDGLKTALCVLEALKYYDLSLKDISKEVKIYPQLLVNEKVNDKKIVLEDEEINSLIKDISLRLGNDGRILVRPSGTEPLIRVMVEAVDDETCHNYVYEVIDLIKKKGY